MKCTRLAVALMISIVAASSLTAADSCDRQCLLTLMDRFLDRLVQHNLSGLPIAPGAKVRQNTLPVSLGEGAWSKTSVIKAKQVFADPVTGQVIFFGAVDQMSKITGLSMRLKVENKNVTEIETIVNPGDIDGRPFDAAGLLEPDVLYDSPLPPSVRRATRAELVEDADSYWTAVGTHDPTAAKFALYARLFQNGQASGARLAQKGNLAAIVANQTGQPAVNRRYPIVDVERGTVVSYVFIPAPDRNPPALTFVSALIKIMDGKIHGVEAINYPATFPPDSGFLK